MLGNNGNPRGDPLRKLEWTAVPTNNTVNICVSDGSRIAFRIRAQRLFPKQTGPLYITINSATVGAASSYPYLPERTAWQASRTLAWSAIPLREVRLDYTSTEDWIINYPIISEATATAT